MGEGGSVLEDPFQRALDERYLRRALQLAERARGHTYPNPLVGAVIVKDGRIVGEGYHLRAGEPHAEVLALREAGEEARGSTLYVTLEPCNHHGRTPPCSLALLQAGISRVVAATRDPHPEAQGGLERLRAAGVEVAVGLLGARRARAQGELPESTSHIETASSSLETLISGRSTPDTQPPSSDPLRVRSERLEAEAWAQNEVFFHALQHRRPFVLWKAALSLDGQVAARSGHAAWVSNPLSRRVAQGYRQWLPAVLVGVGTVLADDPWLAVRDPDFRAFPQMLEPPPLRDPFKVVLDSEARTPPSARLFVPGPRGEAARVAVLVGEGAPVARMRALEARGARVVELPREEGRVSLEAALAWLYGQGIDGVLLEGGPTLAGALLRRGWVDKVALFMAPKLLGEGKRALLGFAAERMEEALDLQIQRLELLHGDIWLEGQVRS